MVQLANSDIGELPDREANAHNLRSDGTSAASSDGPSRDETETGGDDDRKRVIREGESFGPHDDLSFRDQQRNKDRKRGKSALQFLLRHKKAAAVGGVLTGGGAAGIIGVFLALQPLKIDFILSRLDTFFGGPSGIAMSQMSERLMDGYIGKVVGGIAKGRCKTSASPGCVAPISGKGPIAHLYQAWRQGGLEQKLAEKYGIVFGAEGDIAHGHGQLFMHVDGVGEDFISSSELFDVAKGKVTFWDIMHNATGVESGSLSKAETLAKARAAVNDALKGSSLWDRTVYRYRIFKLLEVKYGVKFCVIACNIRDKFNTSIAEKKLAFKTFFVSRILFPVGQEEGIVLLCMINGTDACKTALDKVTNSSPGSPELEAGETNVGKVSPFESSLEETFASFAAEHSAEELAEAVKIAEEAVGKNQSFVDYLLIKILTPVVGESAAELGVKAIPVVGWVLLAAQVISVAATIGPIIRIMSYAINAAGAAQLYTGYKTVDSEMKSGHVDLTEVGSFSDGLHTNASGSKDNQSDASSTPLYATIMGGGVARNQSSYMCNDGSSVPTNDIVCPEEHLDRGNEVTNDISSITNDIPLLVPLSQLVNKVNELIGWIVGGAFQKGCDAMDLVPPGKSCSKAVQQAGAYVTQFSTWVVEKLVPSPFSSDMSGGRTFDMLAAGADVTANKSCQLTLGCAKLTNQQVADLRTQSINEAQQEFESQPLFARLFSTDTPYSLVSQMALAMPSNLPAAASSLASVIGSPFKTIGNVFTNAFAGSKAFAAPQPMSDPFGVIQYGYTSDQIPADPEAYWDQHCQSGAVTEWLNNQDPDPNTGEPVATTAQPCLLIETMTQANGVMFDSSFIPADETNQ